MKASRKNQANNNAIDNDDIALFRKYVKDIKPLHSDKVNLSQPRKRPSTTPRKQRKEALTELSDMLSDGYENDDIKAEDILSFHREGVQKRTFKKLRNGQLNIGCEIDLHGMTVRQAKRRILFLLEESLYHGQFCIRIIHGKGRTQTENGTVSILKSRLNSWLRQHHRVLAFHSTPRNQGGTGALYVLLKKP